MIFAHGSRFGGHALFIKERKPEQHFVSKVDIKPGKHVLGIEFIRDKAGERGESLGAMKLYIDDQVVAEGPMKTQPAKFTLSGDGMCVGFDSGDAVSQQYKSPGWVTDPRCRRDLWLGPWPACCG